jgi:pyruvate formate lyase activating enzyme
MKKASFYHRENQNIRCLLCPHGCLIKPDQRGICGVRENRNGSLVSLIWGRLSAINSDPIEKKPLYHFFPDTEILSLGSFGCNLSCLFCQNHGIAQRDYSAIEDKTVIEPDQIIKRIGESHCGVAFTYNEPIVWFEYMISCAGKVKNACKKTVLVSNGYINSEPLKSLIPVIDAFSIDLKAFNDRFYKEISGGSLEPVKNSLMQIAHSSSHLEVDYLVIPGLNDDTNEFHSMLKWYCDHLGRHVPLHINRYFPHHRMNRPMTPERTLKELFDRASEELDYVYAGNIRTDWGHDTFCPACHKKIIEREGGRINVLNRSSQCVNCGYQLNIIMN